MQNIVTLLPLRTTPDKSSNRGYEGNIWRTKNLILSLQKYLTESISLNIVCPSSEIEKSKSEISGTSNVSLVWTDEETLISGIGASEAIGWYKQQALCLAFVAAQSSAVLKLDPDMVITKNVTDADLWQNNKAASELRMKNKFEAVWSSSAALTGLTVNYATVGLHYTPFIMQPSVAARTVLLLSGQGITLLDLASKPNWTEVALYSVVADAMGGVETFHFQAPLHGSECRSKRQAFAFRINQEQGVFSTIHGYLGLSKDHTEKMIGRFIESSKAA